MKKCAHPNIVRLKEVLDDFKSNKIYLVLEYLECGEITWQSGEGVPLMTIKQARDVARDVTSGLEYLHFQGIIHRDIKPANLLRDKEGNVKISDFGVSYASSLGQYDSDDLELAKTAGTPAFFAPELCVSTLDKNRPPISHKIDVWAFGVTLYCLLFGKVPFIAESEFELFDVIVNQPLVFPDEEEQKPKRESSLPSMFYNLHSNPSNYTQSTTSIDVEPKALTNPDPELESAKDLLRHVLEKDPTMRYDIMDIKQHPWMLEGMDVPGQELFLTSTAHEQKIEVSNEEVQAAVLGIAGRIKKGLSRLGTRALHYTGIKRKGSTSSSSSLTQASSTSTSRSNSRDPSRSRRGSRDTFSTSKRILSVANEGENSTVANPRPTSGTTTAFNETLTSMLDRALNKSANSSSTSLSSSMSSGMSFPNSPRGVVWKKDYAGGSDIPHSANHRSSHSSVTSRPMRALSGASSLFNDLRVPERRASAATVGSGSTQDSFPLTDIDSSMAYMSIKPAPPRTLTSSSSHLNINSLLEEPNLRSVVTPPPGSLSPQMSPIDLFTAESNSSGLETPRAKSGIQFFESPSDTEMTPNVGSFCLSSRSPPSPVSRRGEAVFSNQPLTYEPVHMFTSPVCEGSLRPFSPPAMQDFDHSSSSSGSSSDSEDGSLMLNIGVRENAPSVIAKRLAARKSESNLRPPGSVEKLGSVTPIQRAVSTGVSSSNFPASSASTFDPKRIRNSPLSKPPVSLQLGESAVITTTTSPKSSMLTTSSGSGSESSCIGPLEKPSRVRTAFKGIGLGIGEPALAAATVTTVTAEVSPRTRSMSVAVGEVQHRKEKQDFGSN